MIKLKKYLVSIALVLSIAPMHGMQKGLGWLRKQFNLETHYDVLEVHSGATPGEIKKAYQKVSLKCHPDKNCGNEEAATEKMYKINSANEFLKDPIAKQQYDLQCTFIDLYLTGSLLVGTAATITGLIKAWQLYKEYSSPNAILVEKMELAATNAVDLILNLEFDRYNPTKDTDALSLQFELEPLFGQLSPEVRKQVKQAIVAFDKTLEATYEQCAWHYDGMTFKELAIQNPQLIKAMITQLRLLLEALQLCKKDLQLDRNKPLEFIKAQYRKMIGLGLAGSLGWYAFKKLMPIQNGPHAQPVIQLLGAPII